MVVMITSHVAVPPSDAAASAASPTCPTISVSTIPIAIKPSSTVNTASVSASDPDPSESFSAEISKLSSGAPPAIARGDTSLREPELRPALRPTTVEGAFISGRREEERASVETRGRPTPDALASAQGAALIAAPRTRGATGRLRGAQSDRRVYRGRRCRTSRTAAFCFRFRHVASDKKVLCTNSLNFPLGTLTGRDELIEISSHESRQESLFGQRRHHNRRRQRKARVGGGRWTGRWARTPSSGPRPDRRGATRW